MDSRDPEKHGRLRRCRGICDAPWRLPFQAQGTHSPAAHSAIWWWHKAESLSRNCPQPKWAASPEATPFPTGSPHPKTGPLSSIPTTWKRHPSPRDRHGIGKALVSAPFLPLPRPALLTPSEDSLTMRQGCNSINFHSFFKKLGKAVITTTLEADGFCQVSDHDIGKLLAC